MKKYGENLFFPRLVSMEMAAIFDFRALTKVHITSKPFFKCSDKLHTHRIHINEETYRSVFSFVEYYIFNNFLFKKPKIRHFTFFGVKTYS